MKPRKMSNQKGLIPKLRSFVEALGDRYQKALGVIDEALGSENLKDKIWAVDLILKRGPGEAEAKIDAKTKPETPAASAQELDQLSEQELIQRVRGFLKDWEP